MVNPANGVVIVTGNSVGDTAIYSCDANFELLGRRTLICGDDGQWSREQPVCIRKYSMMCL